MKESQLFFDDMNKNKLIIILPLGRIIIIINYNYD